MCFAEFVFYDGGLVLLIWVDIIWFLGFGFSWVDCLVLRFTDCALWISGFGWFAVGLLTLV